MRKLLAGSLLAILLSVSFSSADLVTPKKIAASEKISGQATLATLEKFKANEPASVIISGEGGTCLGIYVFDAHGNCVARDDITSPQTSDDLTVEWIPVDTAAFSIEIRNAGIGRDAFDFAVR